MSAVPGSTVHEQAVRVAGAFAELGVQELVVVERGGRRVVRAREIDLPALLERLGPGLELECHSLGVVIRRETSGLTWSCNSSGPAALFGAAIARS